MNKDEMKDKISMALKDPVLQQGFEIICKENAELKDKLEVLIAVGNTCTKGLNKQLAKAKKLLTKWVEKCGNIPPTSLQVETEQFISEGRNERSNL